MNIFKLFIDTIYPEICHACSDLVVPGDFLCVRCLSTISPIASRLFPIGKNKSLAVHALGSYDGALQKLVTAKFGQGLSAAHTIGKLMAGLLPKDLFNVDVIVPIPLHWRRYSARGYNQSVEIAKRLEWELAIPYKNVLWRNRGTKFQYLLNQKERHANVENVFNFYPFRDVNFIKGSRVLLVDDLCTTGATLVAAAKKVTELEPACITAVVCARALY